MVDKHKFIAGLPKAELHLYIEGSLEPELLLELSARNGITLPYASADEVRAAYAFESLRDFLDVCHCGMSVLVTEADFYDLTLAYCKRAHADNVRCAEIFFDPQGHTERGVALEAVIGGISAALAVAERDFGFRSGLIMCFLHHLP
jgi:adenosine deaminase